MKKRKNNISIAEMQCYSLPWHNKVVKTYSSEAQCFSDEFATVYLKIGNSFVVIQC